MKLDANFSIVIIVIILAPILCYLYYFIIYATPALLLSFIAKGKHRENSEIAKLESTFNASSRKLIIKELGPKAYFNIAGGINRGLNSGNEFCRKLLGSDLIKSNEDLKFHILIKLYKSFLMDEQYGRANEYLKIAVAIKPEDILTNFWIAESYELLGKPEYAINSYQNLVKNIKNVPITLKDYFSAQADRVRTKGPKTPPPIPGLKYMHY